MQNIISSTSVEFTGRSLSINGVEWNSPIESQLPEAVAVTQEDVIIGTSHCCYGYTFRLWQTKEGLQLKAISVPPLCVRDILPLTMQGHGKILVVGQGCDGAGVYLLSGTQTQCILPEEAYMGYLKRDKYGLLPRFRASDDLIFVDFHQYPQKGGGKAAEVKLDLGATEIDWATVASVRRYHRN